MALIFLCAYSPLPKVIGARKNCWKGKKKQRLVRRRRARRRGAPSAVVPPPSHLIVLHQSFPHRRRYASSHQLFLHRLRSSPLVLGLVVLRMSRSRGSRSSFFLRNWLRWQPGDPTVISCSRRRHCRPPSLEWQCATCNRRRHCRPPSLEFTFVAIVGAAVAAHNGLPQSQAVMSHIRLQSRVVRSNCRPQFAIVA